MKENTLIENIQEKIVLHVLLARETGRIKYLGPDGTNLLIDEIIDEELNKNRLVLANISDFRFDIKNSVIEILDDIALSDSVRYKWYKKYSEWISKTVRNMPFTHHATDINLLSFSIKDGNEPN